MGVDVHILIKNDFYELENFEKSMQYAKKTIDQIKKALYINEEYEYFELCGYYDEDEKRSDIEFYIPLLSIWLKLRKGYWCVWTGWHFCQITNKINGRLHLADDAFDIAYILGQKEVWYCDEFIEDEYEYKTLDELISEVNNKWGIAEYPYSELMQYNDNVFPDAAQFYHHNITDIQEEFNQLCLKFEEYTPTCINRIGNGYVRAVKDGKINLLHLGNGSPALSNDMDDIQKLWAEDFICKLDGKTALFSGAAKQITAFADGRFEMERGHVASLDNLERYFYLNHEAQIKVMVTCHKDGHIDYVSLPYKSLLVKRKPAKCPVCKGKVASIVYGEPSAELGKKAEQGDVVLGGCLITEYSADWMCVDCKTVFVKNN